MRFGIISFAHMHAHAYAHALTTSSGHQLVGIADSDLRRGQEAADLYRTKHFQVVDDLLNQDIDAVIICSPNAHHREHAVAAARAGKHILCEKPIATSLQDAEEMIAEADKAGVLLRTAFPMRHSHAVERVKAHIDSGAIGDIIGVKGTNRGKMPPGWFLEKELSGGGAVMDHTVHVADLIRWILGTEFTRVYAEAGTLLHDVQIDDCGTLVMDLASGAIASLDPSWSRPENFPIWGDVTLELIGTKGVISVDAFNQKGIVYSTVPKGGLVAYNYWGNDADQGMIEAFIRAVSGEENHGASGYDGLKATEVALGAYESIHRGAPVDLPLQA